MQTYLPKIRFAVIFLAVLAVTLAPLAIAETTVPGSGLVQCGQSDPTGCQLSDLFALIGRVLHFIIFFVAVPLAGIVIVWSGILFVASAANEKKREEAKSALGAAVLGLVLTLACYLVIKTILDTLTTGGASKYLGI